MCFGVGPAVAVGADAAGKAATDAAVGGGLAAGADAGIGAAADFGLTDALGVGAGILGDSAPIADAGIGMAGASLFDSAAQAAGISPIAAEAIGGIGGGVDPLGTAAATATGNTAAGTAGADFVGQGLSSGMTPGSIAAQSEGAGFASTPQAAVDAASTAGNLNPAAASELSSEVSAADSANPYALQSAQGALNQGAASGATTSQNLVSRLFGGKGISDTSLALGALAALGTGAQSLFKSTPNYGMLPGPGTTSATSGALFNAPLNKSGYVNRTPVANYQPSTGSFYTYGQAAEPQFFNNNYLSLARGGALNRPRMAAAAPPPRSPTFDTARGDKHVRGAGGGQDDNVNAKLSPGEWVADANFVSAIGDGNNEEGSRRLYDMRRRVMAEKGMRKTVPPKLKRSPLEYLKKAS